MAASCAFAGLWGVMRLLRKAGCSFAAGLGAVLIIGSAGCGGDDEVSGPTGSISLHAVWEGSADVPASVQTVEVLVQSGTQTMRELVPSQSPQVAIAGVPLGEATVRVRGYDVRLNGVPDLTTVAVAPSFVSAPVEVEVRGRGQADAGAIAVLAQPFATNFIPSPGNASVDPNTAVELLIATAVGDIASESVDIDIDGVPQVVGGVAETGRELTACRDGGSSPCGSVDRNLSGFRFRGLTGDLSALSTVVVQVRAQDEADPPRALDYEYQFQTGTGAGS